MSSTVRFLFNKLVRDKQSEFMKEPGISISSRILEDAEFIVELKKKLVEESYEVIDSTDEELIEELADLQEIMQALMHVAAITQEMVETARTKKVDERGGFSQRIFISHVDVPKNSTAYDYCTKQPHKYPMVKNDE